MRFISETSDFQQPVLIVDPAVTRSGQQLAKRLRANQDVEVLLQKEFPARLEHFFLVFTINSDPDPSWRSKLKSSTRVVSIYIKHPKKAKNVAEMLKQEATKNARVISVQHDNLTETSLEKILWFSFTESPDDLFMEIVSHKNDEDVEPHEKKIRQKRHFKRHYIFAALLTLAIYSTITVLLLVAASLIYVWSFTSKSKTEPIVFNVKTARGLNALGRALYNPVRPLLFFFSVGLLPDTLIEMNTQLDALDTSRTKIISASSTIARDIVINDKPKQLKDELSNQIKILSKETAHAIELGSFLEQKIPHWNDNTEKMRLTISTQKDTLVRYQPLPNLIESIIAKGTSKRYLFLFADTTIAKPGGGQLPFYGILTMSDGDINAFELFETAPIDQARTEQIEFSSALRSLAGESAYTLKNSLLSADFSENYRQITSILANEANVGSFDGAIILTDRGLERIIATYSPIYVPDFNETVTEENFSIKYQLASDKKAFLVGIINQIRVHAAQTTSNDLVPALLEAFNEKQIAFLSQDTQVADIFDKLYWAGDIPTPYCLIQSFGCVADYAFPLLSNIGSLPLNRYVQRSISQRVSIDDNGKISNVLTMTVRNTSLAEIFPGGIYNAYMQIIVPRNATIRRALVNGAPAPNPTLNTSTYRTIGFPVDIPAQAVREITLEYELGETLPKGKSIYQLIFQKQVGSPNSDIALEIALPRGATIGNKNISGLVKNGAVFYNTVLNADKLFVLEIINGNP